jgi:transcriptional regulator with XRE-family HTH domain
MPYQRPEGERDRQLLRRFGTEFRRCRLYAGLSQVALAERSGVSQSTISRLERGKASSAAMFKLVRISDAMGDRFPFAFCPHPHYCAWNRLEEDGVASRNRAPIVSEDYLHTLRTGQPPERHEEPDDPDDESRLLALLGE